MRISGFNSVEACEKGAWVVIKDFDDQETDIKIKVVGVDSKKFKQQVNRLSKMNDGKKVNDLEKLEESSIRTLVAITLDWENIQDDEDNEVAFSKEMAEEIYKASPLISNQIIEFARERTNFLV